MQVVGARQVTVSGFTVDLDRQVLLDASGEVVELRPQAFQVLSRLARDAGRLVGKEDLMAAVWPGLVVTDDSLVQAIGDVRRALGPRGHDVVRTIPRRGYMLIVPASAPAPAAAAAASVPPIESQPTRPSVGEGAPRQARTRLLAGLVFAGAGIALAAGVWSNRTRADADDLRPGDRPSIAVLAFKDPAATSDGQLLARGIAEDLVAELARSRDLRVVSHQSSFRFVGSAVPLAQIGQQLRTRYLVDGTVRRAEGEQLRIDVQLLDSRDERIVWSSSQRVGASSVAGAQQALVARISGTLQSKVRNTEERSALAQPPKSLDVYILTQHGKSMMERYSAQGMRDARRFLEQAVAIDPGYALAWVFLGMTNTIDAGLRLTGDWHPGRIGEALAQIERAVTLDPELPIAYVALSQAQAIARNYEAALASAERCMQLSPNDPDCLYIVGKAQLEIGRPEAAVLSMEQALDRNPIPPAYLPAFYATALWANRRYEEAIRVADDCLLRAPDFWRCRQDRIAALVELGRMTEARQEAAHLMGRVPQMRAQRFGRVFADAAAPLRDRRFAAARAAGVPLEPSP